jgi:hypothetical protein
MSQEKPEILRSQIVDFDISNNCIKTEDGEIFRNGEVSILSDVVKVVGLPYAGHERPTFVNRHVTSPFRANLPA